MSQAAPAEAYVVNALMRADILLEEAHAVLDARGVPRTNGGAPVTIAARIRALIGEIHLDPLLAAAPMPGQVPRHRDIEPPEMNEDEDEIDDYVPRDAHYRRGAEDEPGTVHG